MAFTLSCFYFEAFFSFLQSRFLLGRGVLHYLTDFLFVGPAGSEVCTHTLLCFVRMCAHFGVPLALGKTDAPYSELEFLGIMLDTILMKFRLPAEKLVRTRDVLAGVLRAVNPGCGRFSPCWLYCVLQLRLCRLAELFPGIYC